MVTRFFFINRALIRKAYGDLIHFDESKQWKNCSPQKKLNKFEPLFLREREI